MTLSTRADRRILAFILLSLFVLLTGSAFAQQNLVSEVVIHGNRRIPAETIKARIFTKAGDVYDKVTFWTASKNARSASPWRASTIPPR